MIDNFPMGAVDVMVFKPADGKTQIATAEVVVTTEEQQWVYTYKPFLTLTPEMARDLYDALGHYLGVIDSGKAEAVIKAKDEHLKDLRDVLNKVMYK